MHGHLTSRAATLALLVALVVAACGAGAPAASPTTPPSPTPGPVDDADAAMAAVKARSPLFDGIERRNPDLIGQGSWWDAETNGDAWRVTVEVGWGDCQAGCIDRHTWTWTVGADGSTTFEGEEGSPLAEDVLAGLKDASTAQGIGGWAFAGPTCPVERPGDPACAPRMVGGAVLTVHAGDAVVATFTTDGSGLFRLALEPGAYRVTASAIEGLMGGAPAPIDVTVAPDAEAWADIAYDTGIR